MVEELGCSLSCIGFGKIFDSVSKRRPSLPLGRKQTIESSYSRPEAGWRPRRPSHAAILPILARYPLIVQQAIQGMCRRGEAPFHPKIASEPDDEDALPHLRNPKIRGIQQAGGDLITNPFRGTAAVDVPKGRQVRLPA